MKITAAELLSLLMAAKDDIGQGDGPIYAGLHWAWEREAVEVIRDDQGCGLKFSPMSGTRATTVTWRPGG